MRGLALGVFGLLLLIGIKAGSGQFLLYGTLLIVADGVFAIIDARTSVGRRRLLLLQGRIGVLVGLLLLLVWLLVNPQIVPDNVKASVEAVIEDWHFGRRFVGSWAIFIGAIRIIAAVQLRWETKNSLLIGTGGGLLVISGSLLWWLPISEPTGRLLGFLALASGITIIAVALRVRNG